MKARISIVSSLLVYWRLLSACALAAAGPAGQETFSPPGLEAAGPAAGQEAFIHWSAAPLERLADGRIKAVLTLESSSPLENPAAYCRRARLGRFDGPGDPEDAEIHALEWEADGRRLVILGGEYARITVFARAEIQGRPHYAQTAFNLYGRAGAGEAPEPSRLSQAPDWPEFLVGSDGPLYWPQTGQTFTLQLKGDQNAAARLAVWDGGRRVAELLPGAAGFQYQPAHDSALDRAGDAASKPLVFVLPIDNGGLASFTLFVHRSRSAGRDLPAGLGLFSAAAAVSGALVWLARRRRRPCA
jgi:hypothetical protein